MTLKRTYADGYTDAMLDFHALQLETRKWQRRAFFSIGVAFVVVAASLGMRLWELFS